MEKQLTKGMLSVGVDFNPSGNEMVYKAKELSAKMLDLLREHRNYVTDYGEVSTGEITDMFYTSAFNSIIAAQMQLVKYLTWQHLKE